MAQQQHNRHQLTDWLPTTRKEVELQGWDELDVIIFSADAYVDHPSFGAAVIGRILQAEGCRVAIVPQPSIHGDYRDFTKLGKPRMWFAIAPGAMDSTVAKYTAAGRLRSQDAYSPDGRHDLRPEYPTIAYTTILKRLYPDVPVVLGGIEASLRRLTHYDYIQKKYLPSILLLSHADLVIYGMGELPTIELYHRMAGAIAQSHPALEYDQDGYARIGTKAFRELTAGKDAIRQTVCLYNSMEEVPGGITPQDALLHPHEACMKDLRLQAQNFRVVEEESNKLHARRIIHQELGQTVVVNPPFPPMTTAQIDHAFDLPYTRMPHPKYRDKRIPAYEMIKFSVNMHRGCFGGCAFCTISAHQGKFVSSRSKESILNEVRAIVQMPDFKGYLSDLGGPSANMYAMHGTNPKACAACARPSCLHPAVCPNLNTDHTPLLDIYHAVDAIPGIKRSFVGSGVRYDLILHHSSKKETNEANLRYARELITRHVSGRLKVAPEHTSPTVLDIMRKPPFELFGTFKRMFDQICAEEGLRQQIIPYFISSHPGCTEEDMAELAVKTRQMDFKLEQVQDFTPTPLTLSTEAWATGYHPYTLQPIFSATTEQQRQAQHAYFFWYKPELRASIMSRLRQIGRTDLATRLFAQGPAPTPKSRKPETNHKPKRHDHRHPH